MSRAQRRVPIVESPFFLRSVFAMQRTLDGAGARRAALDRYVNHMEALLKTLKEG